MIHVLKVVGSIIMQLGQHNGIAVFSAMLCDVTFVIPNICQYYCHFVQKKTVVFIALKKSD